MDQSMSNNSDREVCCPKCGGSGYLNFDHQPGCDLCCETGIVPLSDADDFTNESVPTEYWWGKTEDGLMVMVEVDND